VEMDVALNKGFHFLHEAFMQHFLWVSQACMPSCAPFNSSLIYVLKTPNSTSLIPKTYFRWHHTSLLIKNASKKIAKTTVFQY